MLLRCRATVFSLMCSLFATPRLVIPEATHQDFQLALRQRSRAALARLLRQQPIDLGQVHSRSQPLESLSRRRQFRDSV